MLFYNDPEIVKSCITEIMAWIERNTFSIKELDAINSRFSQVEQAIGQLRSDLFRINNAVKKAEWEMFITTLPKATVHGEKIVIDDEIWVRDDRSDVSGVPYEIFIHNDDFLYLFNGEHYYIEKEYDEPELVTREMMGFGEHTEYRRAKDVVEITGSGSINVFQMVMDNGRIIDDYSAYENPIIERQK